MPRYTFTNPDGVKFTVNSPVELDDAQIGLAYNEGLAQVAAKQQADAEREAKQGFMPGVKSGWSEALGTGIYGLGEQLGVEGISQYGQGIQQAGQEAMVPITTGDIGTAFDKGMGEGFDELGDFIRQSTGQVVGGLPAYLATRGAGAGIGALAGMPFGPAGMAIGAGTGAIMGPAGTYWYGQNKQRQEEQINKAIDAGQVPPEFDYWDAMIPAIGQSAAENFGLKIIGRFFPRFGEMIGVTSKQQADRLIEDIAKQGGRVSNVVKGAGTATLTEVPVELTQTVLERQAAGLPLTDTDAYKEYEEVAAATVAGVAPLGAGAGVTHPTRPIRKAPDEPVTPEDVEAPPTPQQPAPEEIPEPTIRPTTPQREQPVSREDYEAQLQEYENQEFERARREFDAQEFNKRLDEIEEGGLETARQQLDMQKQKRRAAIDAEARRLQELETQDVAETAAAREDALKDVEKEAATQRKEMDAEYQRQIDEMLAGKREANYVTPQVAEAMGIPKRYKRIRRMIEGQDLSTAEGRATVVETLENYAPADVEQNPIVQRISNQVLTDKGRGEEVIRRAGRDDQTLQMLYDEARATGMPEQMQRLDQYAADKVGAEEWAARKQEFEQRPDAISRDYLDMYRDATATEDTARAKQIDDAAKAALGARKWAGVKSGATRAGKAKMKAIVEGREPDLFVSAREELLPPEAEVIPEPQPEPQPDVQVAEEPVSRPRARRQRKPKEREVKPAPVDEGVEAARAAEPTDTEGAAAPDVGRVAETGGDVVESEKRAGEPDVALDDVEAEIATEEETEPRGTRSAMEAGAINMRNTLARLDPEDRQELTPLVDQFDELNRQNEGKTPTADEKEILGLLTEKVNKALNKVIRRDVDERQAAEDKATAESIARRGNREPRKGKKPSKAKVREAARIAAQAEDTVTDVTESAPAGPVEMPRTAVELYPFMASGMRDNSQLSAAVATAKNEGFITADEQRVINDALGSLENKSGDTKIEVRTSVVDTLIDRMSSHAYMQNDPELVRNMYKTMNEEIMRYYTGLDKVRQVFGDLAPKADDAGGYEFSRAGRVGQPKSTVEALKAGSKDTVKKLKGTVDVEFVQTVDELPITTPDDVRGLLYQGKVYVVADNTSPLELQRVLAHEVVGHVGMEAVLGAGGFKSFVASVNTLRDRSPRVKRIVENIRQNYTNPMGEYNLTREQEAREILAHIAEGLPHYMTDTGITRVWNNIKTKVAQWLAKVGLGNIADADLNRLVYVAAKHTLDGRKALGKDYYVSTDYGSVDMMKRAWERGYRGTDVYEAGKYLRDLHTGDIQAKAELLKDFDATDPDYLGEIDFSAPAYSRAAAPKFNDKFDELDYEPPKDPTLFQKLRDSFMDGSMFNKFRVLMVDSHATIDDKLSGLYQGAIRMSDGLVNPSITSSQAMRAEGVVANWMRTGNAEWDESNGVWLSERKSEDAPSLSSITHRVADLAKHPKVMTKARAARMFNLASIAQREEEMAAKNRETEAKLQIAHDKGDAKLIDKLENEIFTLTMSDSERAKFMEFWDDVPEMRPIFDDWTTLKNNLVDNMVEGGVISKDKAQAWKENIGYVPFYRIQQSAEGENYVGGFSGSGTGLSSIKQIHKLHGSYKEINDVLDNMARVSTYMLTSAIRNKAAGQLIKALQRVDGAVVGKVGGPSKKTTEHGVVVSTYEEGRKVYYELSDPLDAYAFKGIEEVSSMGISAMAKVADWLRKGVTLSPEFIIAQTENDMVRGYQLSGVENPIKIPLKVLGSYYKIRKDLASGNLGDPSLNSVGITGMYDYSKQHTREQVEAAYKEGELSPVQKIFRWGERNAEASDLALRKAIYDQTMLETGDLALATMRANEIINFNRRGASKVASILRQVIPFQNAYMQGMNVLAKAMFGRGLSAKDKASALKQFWGLGLRVATLSTIYAMLMGDDEEYMEQPSYARSRYFMFPTTEGMPMVKFSMPPDLGFMFKVIPEAMVGEFVHDNMDDRKLATELRDAAMTAFLGPTTIPQIGRPVLEQMTNYSFLTGGQLVGIGEQNKPLSEQYRATTSELGRALGRTGLVSPIRFDHLVNGFFGSIGSTMLMVTDEIAQTAFGLNRPDRELARSGITKALFLPQYGAGTRRDFYDLRDKVRGVVSAVNSATERGDIETVKRLLEEYGKEYAARDYVNTINKQLNKLTKAKRVIESDPAMSGAEKREHLDEIDSYMRQLNNSIRDVREYTFD